MKRFFILASAAIVALASCAKTEVVNNSGPQEIAFKQLTGPMTKAEQTQATLSGDMGVYALINNSQTNDFYFQNHQFTLKDGQTYWTGTNLYWPLSGSLDFVVYAPYAAISNALPHYHPANNTLRVKVDNSGKTSINDQTDYLYGEKVYRAYDKYTDHVDVTLKHALAKVTVSFTGTHVKVSNVTLPSVYLSGTYTVDYDNEDEEMMSWENYGQPASITLISPNTGDNGQTPVFTPLDGTTQSASILVVPNNASTITFQYKLGDNDTAMNYEITPNGVWKSGIHYTYSVNIDPKEIKIEPTVDTEWATGGDTFNL